MTTPIVERFTNADQTVSAFDAVALTKSDSTVIRTSRALYVGGGGNVVAKMNSGAIVTFTAVPGGTILPIQITQLRDATTASNVVALY